MANYTKKISLSSAFCALFRTNCLLISQLLNKITSGSDSVMTHGSPITRKHTAHKMRVKMMIKKTHVYRHKHSETIRIR